MNELHFGDNLDVLRSMPAESVDLIYLDPPFNSNADYALLFGTQRGGPSQAQAHAFEDMWKWGPDARRAIEETAARHLQAGQILDALSNVFAESNMMAYLAMMAVRLIEMHRVLKPTGSLYLHCDPTASHYLKILLDAIFGGRNFRSELVWKRSSAHSNARQGRRLHGHIHDTILFYTKGASWVWNDIFTPYDPTYLGRDYGLVDEETGRRFRRGDLTAARPGGDTEYDWRVKKPAGVRERWQADLDDEHLTPTAGWEYKHVRPYRGRYWAYSKDNMRAFATEGRLRHTFDGMPEYKRYLNEMPGVPLQDLWTDIPPIIAGASERLGYPTQKPLALLERIVKASSNEGDTILDPFCGCGTAIDAAQRLGRRWIGIDVTYLAVHVIEGRLKTVFGDSITSQYRVRGRPEDPSDARVLAARDWLEFQKWAVFMLGGLPKDRAGPDGGIDGIIRYHRVGIEQPNRAVVSVKGGTNVGVDAVHTLKSVMSRERAELGVLVCLDSPTRAMARKADSVGDVGPPRRRVPRIQIVTVNQLFDRNPVDLPGTLDPPEFGRPEAPRPTRASRRRVEGQGELLLPIPGMQEDAPVQRQRPNRSIRQVDIEVTRPVRRPRSR